MAAVRGGDVAAVSAFCFGYNAKKWSYPQKLSFEAQKALAEI